MDHDNRKAVLATVVKVQGSSYRNPGARMLILDNGRWVGSVSGGCLEGDVMRKSRQVMQSKKPMLVTYDTMDDDNNTLGVGLGCNGIIDVLIEPLDVSQSSNPIYLFKKLLTYEDLSAIAVVYEAGPDCGIRVGERLLISPEGEICIDHCGEMLQSLVQKDLMACLENKKSSVKSYSLEGTPVEILFEVVEPSIELIIFGAGFDAQPVVEMAKMLGWRVSVSDECIAHMAPANFPDADRMLTCKRDTVSTNVKIGAYSALVLMSHDFHYDLAVLKQILPSSAPYIGILGPRKRSDKLFSALEKEGIRLDSANMARIHTPIGLDIGAESPEEIAMSILTEVLSKFTGRSAGFLKYHQGPIHRRSGISDVVFKQVYLAPDEPDQQIG